jgi:hypothetical protein
MLGIACAALCVTVAMQWMALHRAAPVAACGAAPPAAQTAAPARGPDLSCRATAPALIPQTSPEAPPPVAEAEAEAEAESYADTAFAKAMTDYQKIAMRQQYAAFIASLHLSADKADRFAQLLAEQWTRKAVNRVPMDNDSQGWTGSNDDELHSVLSQAQIDAFHRYQESAETRQQVEMLRNELMATPNPLRDEQIAPLVDALHDEEMRLFRETRDFKVAMDESAGASEDTQRQAEGYFLEREAAANERELAAANAILSREQLNALKRQLEARRSLGIAGLKVVRLDSERQLQ